MSEGDHGPCPKHAAARLVAAASGRRPSRGSGRRSGQSSTRPQILTAALELFAALSRALLMSRRADSRNPVRAPGR